MESRGGQDAEGRGEIQDEGRRGGEVQGCRGTGKEVLRTYTARVLTCCLFISQPSDFSCLPNLCPHPHTPNRATSPPFP